LKLEADTDEEPAAPIPRAYIDQGSARAEPVISPTRSARADRIKLERLMAVA
jgi:hypothetical protein